FGIQITEKAAAQAIPAIGAAGGALINTIFMDHFQDMAKGHFIVRRLERKYGKEAIQDLYGK
ncbi:MAG TPA: EcsC family protein, partial [Bacteroidales bacterium]|nr:EcsC family protein [Bacteroidales bacterium]